MNCCIVTIKGKEALVLGAHIVPAGCGYVWIVSSRTCHSLMTLLATEAREVTEKEAAQFITQKQQASPTGQSKALMITTDAPDTFDPRNN
jgi:hypothetical protein